MNQLDALTIHTLTKCLNTNNLCVFLIFSIDTFLPIKVLSNHPQEYILSASSAFLLY